MVGAPDRSRRTSAPPSGTALAPEAPSWGRWVGVGVAVSVAGAVLLFALGGDAPRERAPEVDEAPPQEVAPIAATRPAPVAFEPESGSAPTVVSQAVAIDQLRRAFGKARLYSQLSMQGDQLELRSAACDDPRLSELLDQVTATLHESGLRRVRCLQPHGQVVFSREL